MNHRAYSLLVVLGTALLAVACSQEAPPAPSAGSTTAAPAEPAVATQPVAAPAAQPIGDATFSVTPGTFRQCDAENGAVAATAKWDVTSKNVAEVALYVVSAAGEKKLWLNGGATGEETTGKWVFPDTTFVLVERIGEKPLGELKVKATPCN